MNKKFYLVTVLIEYSAESITDAHAIAQTICEYLDVDASSLDGKSVWNEIKA